MGMRRWYTSEITLVSNAGWIPAAVTYPRFGKIHRIRAAVTAGTAPNLVAVRMVLAATGTFRIIYQTAQMIQPLDKLLDTPIWYELPFVNPVPSYFVTGNFIEATVDSAVGDHTVEVQLEIESPTTAGAAGQMEL